MYALEENSKEQARLVKELTRSVLLNALTPGIFVSGEPVQSRMVVQGDTCRLEVLVSGEARHSFDLPPKQFTKEALDMGILDTLSALEYLLNKRKNDE